jgi:hypothetical protein
LNIGFFFEKLNSIEFLVHKLQQNFKASVFSSYK